MAGHAREGNFLVGGLQRHVGTQILFTRSFITSPPGFFLKGGLIAISPPFTRKVAGVVDRAALEMR